MQLNAKRTFVEGGDCWATVCDTLTELRPLNTSLHTFVITYLFGMVMFLRAMSQ